MPLNLPNSATEVVNRAKADVRREVPGSNPYLRNSWISAVVTGIANRIYDFYLQLKNALRQAFPDTADGNYLVRWAAIWGITRLTATGASGDVFMTGTASSVIPAVTVLTSSDGTEYAVDSGGTISTASSSVSSLTRSGATVTATTANNHGLASGASVTISGAVETGYNGTYTITVTGLDTFTYTITTTPSTPATGTILAGFTGVTLAITSSTLGSTVNLDADAPLTLQSPISGVDNTGYVTYGGVSGGTAQESDIDLRARFLDRLQNPVANFNAAAITAKAKEVAGVTRVFVQEVTPAVGQVTVYFMRDNDAATGIPDASEVGAVRTKILEILPVNTDPADLFVAAPTAVPIAFTFSSISPDTSTMRTSVENALAQLFDEELSVGEDVTTVAYNSVIYNTVDTVTGDRVVSFTLTAPTADTVIASSEIGTLGAVTWP